MVHRGGVAAVLARWRAAVFLLSIALGGYSLLQHDISRQRPSATPAMPNRTGDLLGRLPLTFEPNLGQIAPEVKFEARGNGYGLYLTDREAVLTLRRAKGGPNQKPNASVVRMQFDGANSESVPKASQQLPGHANYFLGNDRSRWRTNVPQFARVEYRDMYPGIDFDFYGRGGRLEYDFDVRPGADPSHISLRFAGADKLQVAANGDLVIATGNGELRFEAPRIYQESRIGKSNVNGKFVLRGDRVGFELDSYDRTRALVIDPVLTFSTLLGGSGSESCAAAAGAAFVPHCPAIALDTTGRIYLAGATTSTSGWPSPSSPVASIPPLGGSDVFVARISGTGTAPVLDYLTFIGGSAADYPTGLAVDSGFNAYIAGTTTSQDYPTVNGFQLSPSSATVQNHVFFTKLDSTGSRNLYSTYLSGNGIDSSSDLAVDSQGRAYVFGTTTSTSGFPITPGALQNASKAANQFFLTKIDASAAGPNSLLYSTYIGGSNPANGVALGGAVAVDSAANVYIAGGTDFSDMPIVNACQGASQGGTNLWVARLNAPTNNTQIYTPLYESYLGAPGDSSQVDVAYGIATDGTNTYVTGSTTSASFSNALCGTTSGTLTPFQATYGGGTDAFIAKFGTPSTSGTTQGTVPLSYFSYLGGSGLDVGLSVATDVNQNARIAGLTNSGNFPGSPTIFGSPSGTSAFFARIVTGSTSASNTSSTSVLGGSGTDIGTSTVVDALLNSYIAGETSSSNFPVTANAIQGFTGTAAAFATELGPNAALVSFACNPAFPISGAGCASPAPPNPTASPAPAAVGSEVTFTYSIYNQGDPVTGATFTDTLSPNSTLVSITGPGNVSCSNSASCCTTNSVATTCTLSLGNIATSGTTTSTVNGTTTTIIASAATVTVRVNATGPPSTGGFPPLQPAPISNGAVVTVPGVGCKSNCQVAQSVNVNDFAIQATPALQTVTAGAEATYTVTVAPSSTSGFPQSVSLACGSGLPTGAQCTFANNPVPNLNNGAVSRVLNITTTARVTTPASLLRTGPVYAFWLPLGGLALIGGISRKRRWLVGACLALLLGTIGFLPGCSKASNTSVTSGTPAGTYTVTINATSGSAPARTTAVQLVVQ